MDKNEKHVRENDPHNRHHSNNAVSEEITESLPATERNDRRHHTATTNRLWIWLGVIILIFILLYWLFSIGIFEDLTGYFNGN